MFLKVRDEENDKWWFIHNIDRLVVDDPVSLNHTGAEQDFDLRLLRPPTQGVEFCQRINCIFDQTPDKSQKEYVVVFDSEAYLCTDKGETVERFRP